MKELLIKEFKLTASPLTYIFLLFGAMVMIPGYPILCGAFFICLGIFYTFQFAREFNDVLFTALLPVKKSDVVKARIAFSVCIELICFVVCAVLTVIRMTFMAEAKPYVENPLMNANLIYLGAFLLIAALFNAIFVTGFFKTAYYFGKPFIWFTVVAFIFIGVMETLHNIPGLKFLNVCGWQYMNVQLISLAAGVVFYILGTIYAVKKSVKSFEELDL